MGVFLEHAGTLKRERTGLSPEVRQIIDILMRYDMSSSQHGTVAPPAVPADAYDAVEKLLLSGQRAEAVEFAISRGMWPTAMFLAALVDKVTLARAVHQYASTLAEGSSLHTLAHAFALTHKRLFATIPDQPSTPGSLVGNWKRNVATILANPTPKDAAIVVKLGDQLWQRFGDVAAAHMCYLIAGLKLEMWSDMNKARIVLLGLDHKKATDFTGARSKAGLFDVDACQLTQIYEFTKTRVSSDFVLPNFQRYKFRYACLLADFGMVDDAIKYLSAVLGAIARTPQAQRAQYPRFLHPAAKTLLERLKAYSSGNSESVISQIGGLVTGGIWNLFTGKSTGKTTPTTPPAHPATPEPIAPPFPAPVGGGGGPRPDVPAPQQPTQRTMPPSDSMKRTASGSALSSWLWGEGASANATPPAAPEVDPFPKNENEFKYDATTGRWMNMSTPEHDSSGGEEETAMPPARPSVTRPSAGRGNSGRGRGAPRSRYGRRGRGRGRSARPRPSARRPPGRGRRPTTNSPRPGRPTTITSHRQASTTTHRLS